MAKNKKAKKSKKTSKPTASTLRHRPRPHVSARPPPPRKTPRNPPRAPLPTIPFHPTDHILLLGEGDFSFAHSLLHHHAFASLTATALDSRPTTLQKYPQSAAYIAALEDAGQRVLFGVDATRLAPTRGERAFLRPRDGDGDDRAGFTRVVFNFPHAGGVTRDVNRQVRLHQELLVAFFRGVGAVLAADQGDGGGHQDEEEEEPTVVVTLFEGEPYTLWNVRDLARHTGWLVRRSFRFDFAAYPGYAHARTLGNVVGKTEGGAWRGEDREARSFVFARKRG